MKVKPSLGFVYLLTIGALSIILIRWVLTPPWYESKESIGLNRDKYALYLEHIAGRTTSLQKRADWLIEALNIWLALGVRERADRIKVLLEGIPAEFIDSGRSLRLIRFLGKTEEATALAKKLIEEGNREHETLMAVAEGVYNDPSDSFFGLLVGILQETEDEVHSSQQNTDIQIFGTTRDGWTRGTEAGFLVVSNGDSAPVSHRVLLACHAPNLELPIDVTVRDGEAETAYTFRENETTTFEHRLEETGPGEVRMVRIQAAKGWTPSAEDARILGVRIILL